ncbi:transposase, IS4 family protein [Caballeronia catudaia]|uniref:Transposase, IS4 family protein n=1 Tax=Caballeronia catudaia TaxID=1777136 RepID=A0A158DG47_9BURK|nr:transposase, IS4 family protein [Caballeronia catudaia]
MYFLQQWYELSDEGLEDALYDSIALRGFAGIDLAVENVPDATTLLKFRRLLIEHDLTRKLFDEIGISLCVRFTDIKGRSLSRATCRSTTASPLEATIGVARISIRKPLMRLDTTSLALCDCFTVLPLDLWALLVTG